MGTFATREPFEIVINQFDHGLIMMALAHLSLERGDLAARAEAIAVRLHGQRMFIELRDLKLRIDRERRKHGNHDRTEAARDETGNEASAPL